MKLSYLCVILGAVVVAPHIDVPVANVFGVICMVLAFYLQSKDR